MRSVSCRARVGAKSGGASRRSTAMFCWRSCRVARGNATSARWSSLLAHRAHGAAVNPTFACSTRRCADPNALACQPPPAWNAPSHVGERRARWTLTFFASRFLRRDSVKPSGARGPAKRREHAASAALRVEIHAKCAASAAPKKSTKTTCPPCRDAFCVATKIIRRGTRRDALLP